MFPQKNHSFGGLVILNSPRQLDFLKVDSGGYVLSIISQNFMDIGMDSFDWVNVILKMLAQNMGKPPYNF